MEKYEWPVQTRWADLDPNFHYRHSVYYDWAAMCRFKFLKERGLNSALMHQFNFGPVIFREECVFRKEISFDDKISINLKLLKSRKDYSRWTFVNEIRKNENTVCAVITVDGAWMSTVDRKLITSPPEVINVFQQIPKDENFQWLD